jgi:predicted nucleic acid-binding protein
MNYLADTNILLRFVNRQNALHPEIRHAVKALKKARHEILILPQNCTEFWNVATRPVKNNGFGLSTNDADFLLRLIERIFPLLPDTPRIYPKWRELVMNFHISGVSVHDAKIAAAMIVHNTTHILTYNTSDFARYSSEGIVAVAPSEI